MAGANERSRGADRAVVARLEQICARAVAEGRLPIDPEPRRLERELAFAWAAELNRLLDRDAWLDQFTAHEEHQTDWEPPTTFVFFASARTPVAAAHFSGA